MLDAQHASSTPPRRTRSQWPRYAPPSEAHVWLWAAAAMVAGSAEEREAAAVAEEVGALEVQAALAVVVRPHRRWLV